MEGKRYNGAISNDGFLEVLGFSSLWLFRLSSFILGFFFCLLDSFLIFVLNHQSEEKFGGVLHLYIWIHSILPLVLFFLFVLQSLPFVKSKEVKMPGRVLILGYSRLGICVRERFIQAP